MLFEHQTTVSKLVGVFAIFLTTVIGVRAAGPPELRFVNVVFRHGDRTPEAREFYPNDPFLHHDYYPEGLGELTNEGKRRQHELGKTLRRRYEKFLGKIYVPKDIVAHSTDFRRTKMSLSLVLGALYPPASMQKWSPELNWQPIPTTYFPRDQDYLLMPETCPRYIEELGRVRSLPEVASKWEHLRTLLNNLTSWTGQPMINTKNIFMLYHILMAQKMLGFKLPDWTNEIFPYGGLFDGTILEYDIVSYNDSLKRMLGGQLLKRFTDDMLAVVTGIGKKANKMNLFSGHEGNVVSLLKNLGLYKPHIPEYSAAVIVELLQNGSNHYVKVLHYLGIPSNVTELTIPGCNVLCPLDDFLELTKNVTPRDDEIGCPDTASLS